MVEVLLCSNFHADQNNYMERFYEMKKNEMDNQR